MIINYPAIIKHLKDRRDDIRTSIAIADQLDDFGATNGLLQKARTISAVIHLLETGEEDPDNPL